MNLDQVMMNLRYLLIGIGVALMVKFTGGMISEETATSFVAPLVGLLITAITTWWGNYVRSQTKSVPTSVAARADVPTVSPVTGKVEPPTAFRG